MKNVYFPFTGPLGSDTDIILTAIHLRSAALKSQVDSQNVMKRIAIVALKTLGLAAGIVAAACMPVAGFFFTVTPLTVAAAALALSVTALALYTLLEPRSARESIIKEHWLRVFEALREGESEKMIKTCQELAKHKRTHADPYSRCLGSISIHKADAFLQKVCVAGYLQLSLAHLRCGHDEAAKSNAHLALSHFDSSGFSPEIEAFLKIITDSPQKMRRVIKTVEETKNLRIIDILMTATRSSIRLRLNSHI